MTVNEILDLARSNTHATAAQFPNATVIKWANIIYKKLIRAITTRVNENFFVVTRQEDVTSGMSSVALQSDVLKIKQVRFKPTTSYDYYIPSIEVDFSKLEHAKDWYLVNQPADKPIHQIIGNTLHFAPKFTATTAGAGDNNQLEYDYEQRATAIAVDGAESTVSIPLDYHYLIAVGVEVYIFKALGKTKEWSNAVALYKMEVEEMISELSNRDETNDQIRTPSELLLE
jgi:hypothetical protein